jgi:signal transduction protein with GAF and PtsI domain
MKKLNEAFSEKESKQIYDNFLAIVNDKKRRDKLVKKHGSNAEAIAYGTAVNQVKKSSSKKDEKLKEQIQKVLFEKNIKVKR